MYTPRSFALDDAELPRIHALIRAHNFGLLITPDARSGELHLTHLPFFLDARGAKGTLEAHLARANPHAQALLAGARSTAVFLGPHAYVSPRWYADPARNVPTWNYAAVHAHGAPIPREDPETVLRFISRLTEAEEKTRTAGEAAPHPWSVAEARAHAEKLAPGVLAFELPIDHLEAKLKLSQNRPPEDRLRVMRALRERGADAELLALMEPLYSPGGQLR